MIRKSSDATGVPGSAHEPAHLEDVIAPRGHVEVKPARTQAVALALEASPDVASVKLVSGKATLVHHPLWPALLAIATARDAWQLDSLSPLARLLLATVDRDGLFQSDDAAELERFGRTAIAAAARAPISLETPLARCCMVFTSTSG